MPEGTPRARHRLKWMLFALAAWTVLAAIPTSSGYIADGSQGLRRWLWMFSYIAPYYYLWALTTPAIYRLSNTTLHPRNGWPLVIIGHCAIAITLTAIFGLVIHQENWRAWLIGVNAPGYFAMSGFSYIFILLGIYLYRLQERVREQQQRIATQRQRELELEASLAKSQMELLRGQMNPHFLFNALNCIGALIEARDNDRAYEALEDLGGLLRTSLEHRNQQVVKLSDELAFAKRYVALEQVRFGARLRIETRVDSAASRWMVPPFLLQPLIENTVKHALAPSRDTVTITIRARRDGDDLDLQVQDDGCGTAKHASSEGTGVGLENLRKRLALIYGDAASLEIEQDDGGTRVKLRIPFEQKTGRREHTPSEESRQAQSYPYGAAVLDGSG